MSNAITVGQRSDGMITISAAAPDAGKQEATMWLLDAALARWLAESILRIVDAPCSTSARPSDE